MDVLGDHDDLEALRPARWPSPALLTDLSRSAPIPQPFRLGPANWKPHAPLVDVTIPEPWAERKSMSLSGVDTPRARLDIRGSHSTTVERTQTCTDADGRELFVCQECGNTFTRKSSLKVHGRSHTGARRAYSQ